MLYIKRALWLLFFVALLAVTGLYILHSSWNPEPKDEVLYHNGVIITMDTDNPNASAMLVRKNLIVGVGATSDLRELATSSVTEVDLEGKTVIPGFVDGHGHFPGSGLSAIAVDANSPPIGDKQGIEDILVGLKILADKTPKGSWLLAYGFDDTMIAEKRFLTRDELDSVSTEHPIFVMHISAHMSVLNSMGLERAGYNETTQDPVGGEIERSGNGKLTGLVKERAHYALIKQTFNFSAQDSLKITRRAVAEYLQQGVTSVQAGKLEFDQVKELGQASKIGLIPQRVVAWPDASARREMLSDLVASGGVSSFIDTEKFKIGATKFISDGSIQGYTGFLLHPYHQLPESLDDDYRGYSVFADGDIELIRELIVEHKQQIAIHANGDAAIEAVLDLLEPLADIIKAHDLRPIIVHAQMAHPVHLERMKKIGVTPTFYISHVRVWGDRHRDIFMGPERAQGINPLQTSEVNDLPYSIHTDTPVLPMRPMQMIEDAVMRETYNGNELGGEERVTVQQALRATTLSAAWQSHLEDKIGSLSAGKYADFLVLSNNLYTVASQDIGSTVVEKTYIGGALHFQR
jgi:predicted amidohydrolase YtcJ